MKEKSTLEVSESVMSRGNQTTVPKPIRLALKLKPGDFLIWEITDQHVEVKKK